MNGEPAPDPARGAHLRESIESLFSRRRVRIIYLTAVGLLVLLLGYRLRAVLNPFLLALLVAYILDPAVRFFERKAKMPRTVAILVLYVLFGLVATGLIAYSVSKTTSGIDKLRLKSMGGWYKDMNRNGALDLGEAYYSDDLKREAVGSTFLDTNANGQRDPHEPLLREEKEGTLTVDPASEEAALWRRRPSLFDEIKGYLSARYATLDRSEIEKAIDAVKGNTSALVTGVRAVGGWLKDELFGGLMTALSYLILVPVYTFFLLRGFDAILERMEAHLPGRFRKRTVSIASKIDRACSAFFRGRFLICLGKALFTWLGLWAVGVDFALFIGAANGGLAVIPVVGPVVATVLSVIFSYGPEGWLGRIIGAAIVIGVVEVAEVAINPILLGREVGLHPVTYLIALFVGGELLGFFGVILAIPLAAIVKVLGQEFILPEIRHLAAEVPEDERPPPGPFDLRVEPPVSSASFEEKGIA